ncbi:MAG: LytR C-terminal domain-containing protein [Patescibacteria group bacterium]
MIKKRGAIKLENTKQTISQPKKEEGGSKMTIYIVLLIVVVLTAFALMINQKLKAKPTPTGQKTEATAQAPSNEGKSMEKSDVVALINRVASLILVKSDEEPTVATVQDADALRKSSPIFYKDAQNGDRLLVWSDKAVLYSTKLDKLLAVMPMPAAQETSNFGQATSTASNIKAVPAESTIKAENATIEVRNGTTTAGKAKTMSSLLKAQGLNVLTIGDAKIKTYPKTIIVKASSNAAAMPATLAALQQATNAEIVDLPAGEVASKADFLVIVGKDFVK